jgi:putative SOS response-associated peptidase YedK
MCSHYQPVTKREVLKSHFGVQAPAQMGRADMWPGYEGIFIRRHEHADVGDEAVPAQEATLGRWGLIPHWSKDDKVRNTFNARSGMRGAKHSVASCLPWRCLSPIGEAAKPFRLA